MSATNPGSVLAGKDSLLYIKRAVDNDYLMVACQVDYTFTETKAVTSDTTKCGISKAFAPKDAKLTMSGEARTDIAEADDALSYDELSALIDSDDSFSAKITDPNNKIYIEGDVKIQECVLTASAEGNVKFTANFEYTDPGSIDKTATT